MNKTLKQILSGFMIAGDLFLILIFFVLMFEESSFLPWIPLIAFLAADTALSIDYIMTLKKQKQVEMDLEFEERQAAMRRQMKEMQEDQAQAIRIRKEAALSELSVEELQELLQQKQQSDSIKNQAY